MLTCTAELSKAKVQQPQMIPGLVSSLLQHDVAACDVHMRQIAYMEAVHGLRDRLASHWCTGWLCIDNELLAMKYWLHDIPPSTAQ